LICVFPPNKSQELFSSNALNQFDQISKLQEQNQILKNWKTQLQTQIPNLNNTISKVQKENQSFKNQVLNARHENQSLNAGILMFQEENQSF
jgi:uncharacterized protein YlxW (UPF0749 family)